MAALSLLLIGFGSGLVWAGVTGGNLGQELAAMFSGRPSFQKVTR